MLTRRILAVNLVALGILAGGVLYLDQYQRGLIAERLEALKTQGSIVAAALGEIVVPREPVLPQSMDLLLAGLLLQRLVDPIDTRARLFNARGALIVDSRALGGGEVALRELPPPEVVTPIRGWLDQAYGVVDRLLRRELPPYLERADQRAGDYAEAGRALAGEVAAAERRASDGGVVLSVAVPVQRFKRVVGALMLSTDTADIEARVREARWQTLLLSALAFAVTALLSAYLASTIARPIRRLAESAERVTSGRARGIVIPDLRARRDEIGELSVALRRMTDALRRRMDAIEGFAADVAHELKNPLSSLRSAIETIGRVDDPQTRARLLQVVVEDVRRMDRLISEIAAASRLDAELSRAEVEPVDLTAMVTAVIDIYRSTAAAGAPRIALEVDPDRPIVVAGVEGRLAQVLRNLLDNAVSFSPPEGAISVRLARQDRAAVLTIEDQGPGLPPAKTEAIFERFYSERPAGEKFGTHSGLGLSISKQIVEAHGGTIEAENRRPMDGRGGAAGARFTIRLPL